MITRRGLLGGLVAAVGTPKRKGRKPVGWTSQVSRLLIVEGASGEGVFVYSGPPARGNLIASVTFADPLGGTDPYGNTVYPGVVSYLPGTTTDYIQLDGGILALSDETMGTTEAASIFVTGSGGPLAGQLNLNAGGPFRGTGGSLSLMPNPDNLLTSYVATSSLVVAFDPSSGGTAVETWHPITLDNGWSLNSSYDAPQYQILADGNVQFAGLAQQSAFTGTVALNSAHPLQAPYVPKKTHPLCQSSQVGDRARVEYRNDGILYAVGTSAYTTTTAEIDATVATI